MDGPWWSQNGKATARFLCLLIGTVDLLAIELHLWRQDGPESTSPLPVATEVEEEEALMALADLSDSEMLGCNMTDAG